MHRESFEHFYLTKIALAEGCGCAEHVTCMREVDAYAAKYMHSVRKPKSGILAGLGRLLEVASSRSAP